MSLKNKLERLTHIFPLAVYRMAFGVLMCFSLVRFMLKGWVEACFLIPEFHFTYQYFDWIKPLEDASAMYAIVIISAISALFIGIGFLYRYATIVFFLSFTYLELIEQSWYLNHYYFVSIIAFLLCFIPANRAYSIDALLFKNKRTLHIPTWTVFVLKLQISIVYIFAGIAKIKSDWLVEAMPLKIWLKAKTEIPFIGPIFEYDATAYFFSYFGMFYDLTIPFLLWNKRTRPYAFIAVVLFHLTTAMLFQIGMFPWIMIAGSMIFISSEEWRKIFKSLRKLDVSSFPKAPHNTIYLKLILIGVFFIIQLYIPLRPYFYQENQLWSERNYRFSWNVMLMEKTGSTIFYVKDLESGKKWTEYPKEHLSTIQEKQMSFQADMIWQYAQFLKDEYLKKGIENIQVTTNCYVTLNGRPSQLFLPTTLNLLHLKRSDIYDYILPLQ